jgi:hypothetical protein
MKPNDPIASRRSETRMVVIVTRKVSFIVAGILVAADRRAFLQ